MVSIPKIVGVLSCDSCCALAYPLPRRQTK